MHVGVCRREEKDTSMVFLKTHNWKGLLDWMESPKVLGYRLEAYRQACQAASDSQCRFDVAGSRDMDTDSHMIARITMNGFVQMHVMWNKNMSSKNLTNNLANNLANSRGNEQKKRKLVDSSDTVGKGGGGKKGGGIIWTREVETMVKMRMGMIMLAIEILS